MSASITESLDQTFFKKKKKNVSTRKKSISVPPQTCIDVCVCSALSTRSAFHYNKYSMYATRYIQYAARWEDDVPRA